MVDGNLVTGQNQNAGPMVAREMMQLLMTTEHWMTTNAPRYGTVDRDYGLKFATTPPDDDGPVWMVNLMKYRDMAEYADGRPSRISGREADDIYTPVDSLTAVGAEIVFVGDVEQQLFGEAPVWDRIAVVKYPTRRSRSSRCSRARFPASTSTRTPGWSRRS